MPGGGAAREQRLTIRRSQEEHRRPAFLILRRLIVRNALCVRRSGRQLYISCRPSALRLLHLIAAVEKRRQSSLPVVIEVPRARSTPVHIKVTPDPWIYATPSANNRDELVNNTTGLTRKPANRGSLPSYDRTGTSGPAEATTSSSADPRRGGNLCAGPTSSKPALLLATSSRAVIFCSADCRWANEPATAGRRARNDSLHELEIAFKELRPAVAM
jgi:hypothetical protein